MRRPLPIDLGTILANKYRKGLYNHLLHSDRFPQMFRMFKILKMRERERGLECLIPNVLRRQLRAPQSINEGFTNFIWRGYEYEWLSSSLNAITANMNTMNYAICLGFQIWYSLMPSLMLSMGYYDINDLLSPEVVNGIKDTTLEWPDYMIKYATVLCANLYDSLIQSAGVTVDGEERNE